MLPLRALTVGDILDQAFRLLRARFGRTALLVLVVAGPLQLVLSLATTRLVGSVGMMAPASPESAELIDEELIYQLLTLVGVTGVISGIVNLLLGGALVWLLLRDDEGVEAGIGAALGAAARRAWPLLGGAALLVLLTLAVLALVGLASTLLGMVAVPLGVIFALPWLPLLALLFAAALSLLVPTAMVEPHLGPLGTLRRVLWLLRRRPGRIVGVTLLVGLVIALVTFAISGMMSLLVLVAGPAGWIVDGLTGAGLQVISIPVTVFTALLLYVDARVRLEGWDLRLRAHRSRPW